ncbi:MAG: T9SS type A sorting domain-containing protein [Arcticibacter sp.]
MKPIKRITFSMLISLVIIILPSVSNASHLAGGEITYQWLQGNTYRLTLNLYRDCQGIAAPSSATLNFQGCGVSGSINLTPSGSPVLVTPLCPSAVSQSSCNGGTLFSIQRITYTGVHTLPFACSSWVFSYDDCCRSNNTNLASSFDIYYKAILNNLSAPFNNSVEFASLATNTIPVNTTSVLGWNAHDADGDSLVFELAPALQGPNQQVVYQAPFTFSQPLAASQPTVLDSQTGNLTLTPSTFQNAVVCMKVTEYRNSVMVGVTYRDLQLTVISGGNALPSLSGINGTTNYNAFVCVGDTLSFNLTASDPDTGQVPAINADMLGTTASFTTGGNPSVGTFTWIPDSSDISSQAYVFPFTVVDGNCGYMGLQSYAITVYVSACNSNNVWPGDVNYDGIANAYDVLSIGLAYGDTGSVRPNASTQYYAQPAVDWTNSFPSGINHKHADTDGNGLVDWNDTLAIGLNYGIAHPLRIPMQTMMPSADLSITLSEDTIGTSMPVDLFVSISSPIDSVSGLAFRIQLDTALVKINQTTIDYAGSIFGNVGVDVIKVDRIISSNGTIEVGLSRNDHANISGMGQVVRIGIVTTDNVSGKTTLYADPMDIEGVTADGTSESFSPIGTALLIDPAFTGLTTMDSQSQLMVAPIPAKASVMVTLKDLDGLNPYEITDVQGRLVTKGLLLEGANILDISSFQNGCYHLKVITEKGILIRKIMKI